MSFEEEGLPLSDQPYLEKPVNFETKLVTVIEALAATPTNYKELLEKSPELHPLTIIVAKVEAMLKDHEKQEFFQTLALHCAKRGMIEQSEKFSLRADSAADRDIRLETNRTLNNLQQQLLPN